MKNSKFTQLLNESNNSFNNIIKFKPLFESYSNNEKITLIQFNDFLKENTNKIKNFKSISKDLKKLEIFKNLKHILKNNKITENNFNKNYFEVTVKFMSEIYTNNDLHVRNLSYFNYDTQINFEDALLEEVRNELHKFLKKYNCVNYSDDEFEILLLCNYLYIYDNDYFNADEFYDDDENYDDENYDDIFNLLNLN